MMGIEPTNGGTTNHCLNHLATLAIEYYKKYIINYIILKSILYSKFYKIITNINNVYGE